MDVKRSVMTGIIALVTLLVGIGIGGAAALSKTVTITVTMQVVTTVPTTISETVTKIVSADGYRDIFYAVGETIPIGNFDVVILNYTTTKYVYTKVKSSFGDYYYYYGRASP